MKIKNIKFIDLENLKLKTFTEQDALDYCQLNNIKLYNITELDLSNNELTEISGIKLFKNIKKLYLFDNKIKDISVLKDLNKLEILNIQNTKIKHISVLQYLNNLRYLSIDNLNLKSDQVKYINFCKKLKFLKCDNGFKNISVIKQLNIKYNILKI